MISTYRAIAANLLVSVLLSSRKASSHGHSLPPRPSLSPHFFLEVVSPTTKKLGLRRGYRG